VENEQVDRGDVSVDGAKNASVDKGDLNNIIIIELVTDPRTKTLVMLYGVVKLTNDCRV